MRPPLYLAILACGVAFCSVASARETRSWSYDQLTEAASFVVIATPVEVHEFEKAIVPVTKSPAVRVETTFETLSVLKGDKSIKKFVLGHFRHDETGVGRSNGANLITFDPKGKKRYLLFLTPDRDGRYSSVTGQTDPVDGIKDLGLDH